MPDQPDQPPAPRALITGISGQDGSYLAEFLLAKGYEVHGLIRRASLFNTGRIDHIYQDPHVPAPRLRLHYGDMTDVSSLRRALTISKPQEVYNLAAQSHVRVSFDLPIYTAESIAMGTLNLLEAVRQHQQDSGQPIRFYQASSSEQFGLVEQPIQNESTPFRPRSPYACAKVMAHDLAVNYRESYGMFACCGIMFNHESPRRGETFVTRKITRAAGRIRVKLDREVYLGNLDARRDWGFAGDYVKAMWLMLQQDKPDDYVIATGRSLSVREFGTLVFEYSGLRFDDHVRFDPRYLRPAEVPMLRGDASKAAAKLGWTPTTTVEKLAWMMANADWEIAKREKLLREAGHQMPAREGHDQQ